MSAASAGCRPARGAATASAPLLQAWRGHTVGSARDGPRIPAFVVLRAPHRRLHAPCLARTASKPPASDCVIRAPQIRTIAPATPQWPAGCRRSVGCSCGRFAGDCFGYSRVHLDTQMAPLPLAVVRDGISPRLSLSRFRPLGPRRCNGDQKITRPGDPGRVICHRKR